MCCSHRKDDCPSWASAVAAGVPEAGRSRAPGIYCLGDVLRATLCYLARGGGPGSRVPRRAEAHCRTAAPPGHVMVSNTQPCAQLVLNLLQQVVTLCCAAPCSRLQAFLCGVLLRLRKASCCATSKGLICNHLAGGNTPPMLTWSATGASRQSTGQPCGCCMLASARRVPILQ